VAWKSENDENEERNALTPGGGLVRLACGLSLRKISVVSLLTVVSCKFMFLAPLLVRRWFGALCCWCIAAPTIKIA
jgi:hypothetical protein